VKATPVCGNLGALSSRPSLIPLSLIMFPSSFPFDKVNIHFFELRDIPYILHLSKTCLRWVMLPYL